MVYCYARKYCHLLNGNLSCLESLKSEYAKTHAVKPLVVLSKFLGKSQDFRKKLKDFGIKTYKPDSFASFLRILGNNSSDWLEWYKRALTALRTGERLFLKFTIVAGLRRSEATASFNVIIQLAKENRLQEYYDSDLQCLQHFKYKEAFLRRTKNCYISFASKELIFAIANSKPVTYPAIRKRLSQNGIKCRIAELGDYFGTHYSFNGYLQHYRGNRLLQTSEPINAIRDYAKHPF